MVVNQPGFFCRPLISLPFSLHKRRNETTSTGVMDGLNEDDRKLYSRVDEKVGPPDLNDLLKRLAPEFEDKWQEIGPLLKVDRSRIVSIENNGALRGSQNACFREILHSWKIADELPYEWSTVLQVLASEYIGGKRVVKRICDEILNRSKDSATSLPGPDDKSLSESTPSSMSSFGMDEANSSACSKSAEDFEEHKSESSGTGSDDTLTYLCGCGICTIEEFFQGVVGCKNPGRSEKFPLLDTAKLSPDKQIQLAAQLTEATDDIQDEFALLAAKIAASFTQRNIELSELKVYFSTLEVVKARAHDCDDKLLNPIIEEIKETESISNLFTLMANFWSWFNYRLLERVVKHFGGQTEKDLVGHYVSALKTYLERYVYEMPSSIHNPKNLSGFTKFSLKIEDEIRNTKASDLPLIQSALGRILEVDPSSLILATIKNGCVELGFLVPESFVKYFPLSEALHEEIFRLEWKICTITCGNAEPEYFRNHKCNSSLLMKSHKAAVTELEDDQLTVSGSSGIGTLTTTLTKTSEAASLDGRNVSQQKHNLVYEGIIRVCQSCFLYTQPDEHDSLIAHSCLNPELHDGAYQMICTAWDKEHNMLVQIRPLPQMAAIRGFALCNQSWCHGEACCTFAHGEIEKLAWNWEINKIKQRHGIKKPGIFKKGQSLLPYYHKPIVPSQIQQPSSSSPSKMFRFVFNRSENYSNFNKWRTKFTERLQRTKLEKENVELELTVDNYQEKFYHLLCFEEMEHINVLSKRCDSRYEFELLSPSEAAKVHCLQYEKPDYVGVLLGMTGNQIAYATQSSEGVFFVEDDNSTDTCICKANILSCNFSSIEKAFYVSLTKRDVDYLKQHKNYTCGSNIFHVEFEVKHGFFDNLHKAIVNLPIFTVRKLMPTGANQFSPISLQCSYEESKRINCDAAFIVADGAQFSALCTVISASHRNPVLISGPFGSGKTRVLARATYELIKKSPHKNTNTRILICAQNSASIHTYINDYFSKFEHSDHFNAKILRITRGTFPKRNSSFNAFFINLSEFREAVLDGQYVNEKCLVIITTYMTSMQLLSIIKEEDWYFTHVFLDEAAQVREPEAIASLCLTGPDTKIVLAGDTKQAGPALVVLGEQARENGLGVSLLARLEKQYKTIGSHALQHLLVLKDNYRCNHQITLFLSSLFYDGNVQSRTSIPLHPKMRSPFVFYCSDIESIIRAPQEASFAVEAEAVAEQIAFYYGVPLGEKWPAADIEKICIIAPNRNQVNVLKHELKQGPLKRVNILTTHMIQGHEFESVFLSTSEPLDINGCCQDPQRSLCNPNVFNTAISRAKSLVVAVGNPFMLMKCEEAMGYRKRCWREYLRTCLNTKKIFFPHKYAHQRAKITTMIMESIRNSQDFVENKQFTASVSKNAEMSTTPSQLPTQPADSKSPDFKDSSLPEPVKGMSYANVVKGTANSPSTQKLIRPPKKSYCKVDEEITDLTDSDLDEDSDTELRNDRIDKFIKSFSA